MPFSSRSAQPSFCRCCGCSAWRSPTRRRRTRFHRNGARQVSENFVEIFTGYPFFNYFLNSVTVAFGATVVALPLAAAIAYAFARYNTGGMTLRLVVLSSQMLPPVILVLTAVHAVPQGLAAQQLARPHRRSPDHQPAVLGLAAGGVLRHQHRPRGAGGTSRRRDAPSSVLAHHAARGGTRDSGCRPSLPSS